jgi:glycosyltransferase involved in cell wall biosynthesis
MRVSLIATVKNEAGSLPHWLASIAAQARAPDEIVIVDGGSTDRTLDVLHEHAARWQLRIIEQPGANISQGRNRAIREATGDIICSTDAGTRLDENWVEELVKPFEDGGQQTEDKSQSSVIGNPSSVDVVSGFFIPAPVGVFETALAATTLPALADIHPAKFLPSSRSIAFRKSAWEAVSGYPEWLDYCEDLIFDFALRDAGFRFVFAPRAVVHFRPRSNLRAFFRQYYQYARGDGKANLWFARHVIRYATYLIGVPFLLALFGFGLWGFGFLILGFGFIGMFWTPYKRLVPMLTLFSFVDKLRAVIWVPIIRITGDIAKMLGYPAGVAWRARTRLAQVSRNHTQR